MGGQNAMELLIANTVPRPSTAISDVGVNSCSNSSVNDTDLTAALPRLAFKENLPPPISDQTLYLKPRKLLPENL